MRWRFDLATAGCALVLFVLLVLLATAGAGLGWIRSFAGDVVAVVWVHCLLAAVVWLRPPMRPLLALAVGLTVEAAQYVSQQAGWQVSSPVLRIVLGSTPDWLDVVAYLIGFVLACTIERRDNARASPVDVPAPRVVGPDRVMQALRFAARLVRVRVIL